MTKSDDVAIARQHVERGEESVQQQREMLARMRKRGWPTDQAERVLRSLENLLELDRQHLDQLLK